MATENSTDKDALDLAGLEDEVNDLLNEVDDLTGGTGAETEAAEVDREAFQWGTPGVATKCHSSHQTALCRQSNSNRIGG